MIKHTIGTNAGHIWQYLSTKSGSTLEELKNGTNLNDYDLYLALGWLAREGNIAFDEKDDERMIYWIF